MTKRYNLAKDGPYPSLNEAEHGTLCFYGDVKNALDAASKLLEALRELEALFDSQGDARPYTWRERLPMLSRARAAINKARGIE